MFFILLCVRVHVVFSKVNGLLLGLFFGCWNGSFIYCYLLINF